MACPPVNEFRAPPQAVLALVAIVAGSLSLAGQRAVARPGPPAKVSWAVNMSAWGRPAADATMAEEINAKVVVARKTAATELLARGKTLQASGNGKEARRVWSLLV